MKNDLLMSLMQFVGRITNRNSTHIQITELALDLIKVNGLNQHVTKQFDADIISASNDPDETPMDLWVGHFYGVQKDSVKGSYMSLWLGGKELNALNNFAEWYNDVILEKNVQTKARYLGSALHYMQDLTAPHHFHNLPAKTSMLMYGWDTHQKFEDRAKELIKHEDYKIEAYNILKTLPDIKSPLEFATQVNSLARNVVPDYKVLEQDGNWDAIINKLLPLAIAATAKVIISAY